MPVEENQERIRIRVKDPADFVRFRTQDFRPGITAVIGFKEGGGSEVQSLLFDKPKFTKESAEQWVKEHMNKSLIKAYDVFSKIILNKAMHGNAGNNHNVLSLEEMKRRRRAMGEALKQFMGVINASVS